MIETSLSALFRGNSSAINTPPAIEDASLRSDRFRLEREGDWRRLDTILTHIEQRRTRRLSDDDVLALPVLYRTAASSLAVARETSLDAATLRYLETLVQRAWFQVYGPRRGFIAWLREFLGGGLSCAVRSLWLDICIALFVMVSGAIVGWLLVAQDNEWFFTLVPGQFLDTRQPGASREVLQQTLAVEHFQGGGSGFAAQLFTNNANVCILAFALGFAFGLPTLLLLVKNMAVMGAFLWLYHSQGLTGEFAAWLAVHGTTEIFGILLAGAAGIHVGRTMAFPGQRSILAATAESGRKAAVVMVGVVIMMIVAALLEAFPRQLAGTQARALLGGFMLIFWITYFFAFGYGNDPGESISEAEAG